MHWRKSGKPAVKETDLSAYIDEASEIEGKYSFSGTAMLNGKFTGEIASNDTLIICDKAVVNASIRAAVVLVNGEVAGNILASGRVELRATARGAGAAETPVIVVDEGVVFAGHGR